MTRDGGYFFFFYILPVCVIFMFYTCLVMAFVFGSTVFLRYIGKKRRTNYIRGSFCLFTIFRARYLYRIQGYANTLFSRKNENIFKIH